MGGSSSFIEFHKMSLEYAFSSHQNTLQLFSIYTEYTVKHTDVILILPSTQEKS